jgi:hypothetical protein
LTGYAVVYWQRHSEMSTSKSGEQMMKLLRDRATFEVIESIIVVAAYRFNPGIMEILLEAIRSSLITETL